MWKLYFKRQSLSTDSCRYFVFHGVLENGKKGNLWIYPKPIERKFCFATYRGIDNWLITDRRTRVLSFTSNFCIGNEGYGLNCCEKRSLQIARMDSASRELEAITVSDRGIREYRECARVSVAFSWHNAFFWEKCSFSRVLYFCVECKKYHSRDRRS